MKDMKFFMIDLNEEADEVTIPGINKFKFPKGHEQEGCPVPWIMKPITTKRLEQLSELNTKTKLGKSGKQEKVIDNTGVTIDMMVDTIVYPDFKNKEWLEKEGFVNPADLIKKVLSLPGDFSRMSKTACKVNGLDNDEVEMIEEAKN